MEVEYLFVYGLTQCVRRRAGVTGTRPMVLKLTVREEESRCHMETITGSDVDTVSGGKQVSHGHDL